MHGQALLQGELLQRVGRAALLVGRAEHADNVLAALDQHFEHRFAEGLLAVDNYPHTHFPCIYLSLLISLIGRRAV
jgi:hypothetical protein